MLRTKVCNLLGIELPILAAGMGGVALSALAAAVSEAGGFGTIATAGLGANLVAEEIASARRLTNKPFGAGLLIPLLAPDVFACVIKEHPAAIIFFWGDVSPYVPDCRKAGIKVICQAGSVEEAVAAVRAGADAIIAQGFEAGGHV
ncbi:MAG: NAD(P)H-dependent flavin oxidoreductase, partial [Candidatus Binataceae bacterium]